MEDRKYILTDDTKEVNGYILHRIQAVKDFGTIKNGDLGGWIEKEDNLSHEGTCWVDKEAYVYGGALVEDEAFISGHALLSGSCHVYDFASIFGHAKLDKYVTVCERAQIFENGYITDSSVICGKASIFGDAYISGILTVEGMERIWTGNITNESQYLAIGPIGSRDDYTTFFRGRDNNVYVSCGCFRGSIDEFKAQVHEKHHGTIFETEYMAAIEMAKRCIR